MRKKFEEVADELTQLETRMNQLVNDEVKKLHEFLEKNYISETKMLKQQVLIKDMVRNEMVTPLRNDLNDANFRHDELARHVDIQNNDLHRLLRNLDSRCTETNNKFTKVCADIMDEVEIRAKRSELEDAAQQLRDEMQNVNNEIQALKDRTVAKLNEFVDHFGKVQETIDDHEHCLRHHAEELENRATKYDLLVQQNRIDRCCLKEEIDEEFGELKQVVEWQTDKIENFALTTAMGGAGGGKKRKSMHGNKRRSTESTQENGEELADALKGEQAESPISEGEDDDADGELGIVFLVRSQLESLALGVVGLAHATLREPKLGGSKQERLTREQDLIELLGATRHWITHKTAPGGWDPVKLLSVGLQCAHPIENGPRANLPQIPKSVLESNDGKEKGGNEITGSKGTFVKNGRALVDNGATVPQGGAVPKPPKGSANTAPLKETKKGLAGLKTGLTGAHETVQDLNKLEGLPMIKA